MKLWVSLFLVLLSFSMLAGCASSSKETKIRCPKCASFFDTREGEELFKWMHGR